ncbi:M28 family metallopeptidase [Spirillospora sp. CA-294931]|uniref:M28 family metallopeptidase n=1 Tax=Spirillospora sp. CA-294931 TaxID=3240042 RepID=UPI003D8C88E2
MTTRLDDDLRLLAALDRRTTTPGERRSAELIAGRLREIGADEVTVSSFRGPSSWAPAQLAYLGAGVALGLVPGRLARVAALAVAGLYEAETSGRIAWAQRAAATGRGVSVSARLPAEGTAERTLVLLAHHDAAHTGLVWHPHAVALSRGRARRTGRALPSHGPALAGLVAMAIPSRPVRRAARVLLALGAALMVESMRSPTTPGANDNASGVAAVLELARRLAAAPLPGTEVLVVFPGGEEVGNAGMRAWLRDVRPGLDPSTTLVVNLDAVGSAGDLAVSEREGLSTGFADDDVALALAAAGQEDVPLQVAGIPNATDAVLARHAGLRTISLLSLADGWIGHLHRRTDTPDRVSARTLDDAVRLTERIARNWARP